MSFARQKLYHAMQGSFAFNTSCYLLFLREKHRRTTAILHQHKTTQLTLANYYFSIQLKNVTLVMH